ncbi:hypothetical protein [uncultured Mediterranean phage]|nr:hypothetical protein [uncultured Mediterranean phage]
MTITSPNIQSWAHPSLPVQVCRSAAGYYIGQMSKDGSPYSRLSDCYYRTHERADEALTFNTWIRKETP